MFTTDPHAALVLSHQRIRQLQEESAAERLRRTIDRRAFATWLRRATDRLDPAPLAPRAA